MPLSVVIITKNEAHIIGTTLQSLQGLTDDFIIVDSGSTDATIEVCKKFNATIIETTWDGYGQNKNKGIDEAKYNWILNLDADEAIDAELKAAIMQLQLNDEETVYNCKFKNFFCNKWIRFGEWAGDKHVRLFNRNKVRWNTAAVHEGLMLGNKTKVVMLPGNILHYTTQHIDEYIGKTIAYARLNAQKYQLQGKQASFFKLRMAPGFTFFQHYILRLGFLDGWEGYLIAKTTAWYTFLKYSFLKEMNKNLKDKN
ncbi:glycosyltransferase family 2 protein [Ferruginibacter sp.]|nr:glycosyltransferase family 2 protein [Ferruginibacter sp.]